MVRRKTFVQSIREFIRHNFGVNITRKFLLVLIPSVGTFLTLSIFSRILEPQEFGDFIVMNGIGYLALPLLTVGMHSSIVRSLFDETLLDTSRILALILILVSVNMCIVAVVFAINTDQQWMRFPLTIVTYCSAIMARESSFLVLRISKKVKRDVHWVVLHTSLSLVIPLAINSQSHGNLIIAFALTHLILSFLLTLYVISAVGSSRPITPKSLYATGKYAAQLLPHNVLRSLIANLDKLLLFLFVTREQAGQYGAALQFFFVLGFVIQSLNYAHVETISNYNLEEHLEILRRYINKMMMLSFALAIAFSIIVMIFKSLLVAPIYNNNQFNLILLALCLSTVFEISYLFSINFIQRTSYAKKIWHHTFFSASLGLIFSLITTIFLGALGVAFSTLFTYFILAVSFSRLIRNQEPVNRMKQEVWLISFLVASLTLIYFANKEL